MEITKERRLGDKAPAWKGGRIENHGYVLLHIPDNPMAQAAGYVRESRIIAEKVLGGPLPKDAVVHHVDENKGKDLPNDLVICEDEPYHRTIHRRIRTLRACGHANWFKCKFCKKYDDPSNLTIYIDQGFRAYHKKCSTEDSRKRRKIGR